MIVDLESRLNDMDYLFAPNAKYPYNVLGIINDIHALNGECLEKKNIKELADLLIHIHNSNQYSKIVTKLIIYVDLQVDLPSSIVKQFESEWYIAVYNVALTCIKLNKKQEAARLLNLIIDSQAEFFGNALYLPAEACIKLLESEDQKNRASNIQTIISKICFRLKDNRYFLNGIKYISDALRLCVFENRKSVSVTEASEAVKILCIEYPLFQDSNKIEYIMNGLASNSVPSNPKNYINIKELSAQYIPLIKILMAINISSVNGVSLRQIALNIYETLMYNNKETKEILLGAVKEVSQGIFTPDTNPNTFGYLNSEYKALLAAEFLLLEIDNPSTTQELMFFRQLYTELINAWSKR